VGRRMRVCGAHLMQVGVCVRASVNVCVGRRMRVCTMAVDVWGAGCVFAELTLRRWECVYVHLFVFLLGVGCVFGSSSYAYGGGSWVGCALLCVCVSSSCMFCTSWRSNLLISRSPSMDRQET